MVRTANHAAGDLVVPFGFRGEGDAGGFSGLDRLFDPEIGDIEPVLDVGRAHVQGHRFSGFYPYHGRLNAVLLHYDRNMPPRRLFFVASRDEADETYQDNRKKGGNFHIGDQRHSATKSYSCMSLKKLAFFVC